MQLANALFAALLALSLLPFSYQDPLNWQLITPLSGSPLPPARFAPALIHDEPNNRLVLFGGLALNGTFLNDTWQFNFTSVSWQQILVPRAPPPRHTFPWGHSTNLQQMIIATGQGPGVHYNDIWAFSLIGNSWQELPNRGDVPQPRYGSGGGIYPGSNSFWLTHGFASKRYSDTYEYNLTSSTWAKRSSCTNPYNPNKPHSRCLVASTLLSPSQLVLYGGCMQGGKTGGPCPANDGWVFNTTAAHWHSVDTKPSPRRWASMVRAPNMANHVLLLGGAEVSKQTISVQRAWPSEVDVLDVASGEWLRVTAAGSVPPWRWGAAAVEAANGTAVFWVGGELDNKTYSNELYMLTGNAEESPQTTGSAQYFIYPHSHGLFMSLAWGFFLPAGFICARYFKRYDPLWFKYHRALQILGTLLSIIGFVLVFVGGAADPDFAHGIIGLLVFSLGLLQPINAYFRPHQGQKYRKPWEWLHLWTGRFALALGLVNISLGLFLVLAPSGVWIAWFVWLGVLLVLIVLPLEVLHQWRMWVSPVESKEKSGDSTTLQEPKSEMPNNGDSHSSQLAML